MNNRETATLNPLKDYYEFNTSDHVNRSRDRTVSFLFAILLTCLAGWWLQNIHSAGGLSLPYVRSDIIIVSLLCMLPLALLLSEWVCVELKRRRFQLFLLVQSLFFIGTLIILIQAVNNAQSSSTFSGGDAWESLVLRPTVAFFVMTSLLLVVGNLVLTQETTQIKSKGALVWFLALLTALVVPTFYVESRVDEVVTNIEEYIASGRLGDARRLTREVTVLSPWAEIDSKSAGDVAHDLDRACYDLEQSLAFMKLRPVPSEEQTYHAARLHTILGQPTKAIRLLEPWSDKSSTSPLTLQLLGNIYQHQENWVNSERYFRRSLKAWQKLPKSEQQQVGIVSAWKGIAFAERKRGNYEAAENAYLSALLLAPTADQHFLLAQFYEDTQQTAKAHKHAQQAMVLNPTHYETSGKKLIGSLQQQHFGCLSVWRHGSP
ncbi:tetratricopeptide repeat protein [Gimesia aquarii]|uniref:Tetratricopeptide repeat protein n=1 Tax=Gimesia aquarii TaxID=2527964 RepID=A0A517WXQ0_9PLAN|nr:tetratricopeptide repeat protein [Gimesia aquarii]QDU10030.1 Tetratricopeptide repeat protein [Gimesia aquarii]